MRIDNSSANAFLFCPAKFWEWKIQNLEKRSLSPEAKDFGKRVHELLEDHFRPVTQPPNELPRVVLNEEVENEAQEMFSQYLAHYPEEDFEVVEVERTFEVPLEGSGHTYTGKFDGVVRSKKTNCLSILEHKTEKRGSKNNIPEVWAARTQVSLYIWAGEKIYGEPFDGIILDVLTRRSPAGRIGPGFRRDTLQRNEHQREMAVKNITWVAEEISRLEATYGRDVIWPQHTENCCKGGWKCDYFDLHVTGEGERNPFVVLKYFQEAERYLDL